MTTSTMTLAEAAALVPMTPDRLGHWAELGAVPGAKHAGKRKHWQIQREPFLAGLVALQVLLAQVEHYGSAERNPATGLPFVAGDDSLMDAAGVTVEVTDAVRLLPTVEQAMASQCRMPWWSWERAWSLPSVIIALVSFTLGMFVR